MEGLRPKMSVVIGGKRFHCLIDTGADRTVLREEEVPPTWELADGPSILGVGGNSRSKETVALMKWVSPDGEQGKIRPLVAKNLTVNLLGQDMLGQMDAVVTTDHQTFYEGIPEEGEAQGHGGGMEGVKQKDCLTNRKEPKESTRVYPQS